MNTVEILQAAKAKIATPANWITGYYAHDAEGNDIAGVEPEAVCFCSLGAIESVTKTEHKVEGWPDVAERTLNLAASQVSGVTSIVQYNDQHTHEEVMAVWDKAIELAIIAEGAK